MNCIKVKDWDKFQHYKKRSPPWIKLHTQLLDNDEFEKLPDESKAHLILLWLLNARKGNGKIAADEKRLTKKLSTKKKVKLQPLIEQGFIEMIASCKQSDSKVLDSDRGETEREAETEEKAKKQFTSPTIEQINQYCKEKNIYIDAADFVEFYGSKGWMVGCSKMKDWRLAVCRATKWEINKNKQPKPPPDIAAEQKKAKQGQRDKYEQYLRGKSLPALKDLAKDKKSHLYMLCGWLIEEVLVDKLKGARK